MPHTDLKDPKDGSETFGVNKALCEQHVMRVFGERGIVSRPTYIIGPGDTTDRFPYWPVRLSKGGRVVNGIGADTDIIVASAKAYISALNRLSSKDQKVNPQHQL